MLLPPVCDVGNALFVQMRDACEPIHALHDLSDEDFVLALCFHKLLLSLFGFHLHTGNYFHRLRERLVAFGQLIEALVNVPLARISHQRYSKKPPILA